LTGDLCCKNELKMNEEELMIKKRVVLIALIIAVLSLIPYPILYRDGGTRIFNAILYRVVIWKVLGTLDTQHPDGYSKTGVEVHLINRQL